jgi:elongation factor G
VLRLRDALQNVTQRRKERVNRLLHVHANKTEEIDRVGAGNIAAAVGLKFSTTGDTLISSKDKEAVTLVGLEIPEPVIFRSLEAKTAADQSGLEEALKRLQREDPSFTVRVDPDSGQTLICGQGELHLEVMVDRLLREYRVAADVGKPQVAYRETISRSLEKSLEYDHELGTKRRYAKITLEISPRSRGTGNEFSSTVPEPTSTVVLTREMLAAANEGIRDAVTRGPLLGYPMVDIDVTLTEAFAIEGDSNASSFRAATSMAMMEAFEAGTPRLLEPRMTVEIVTQVDYTGSVVSDLTGRRGRVQGIEPREQHQIVTAEVPLAEMVGYATALRSATQGRASFTMQLHDYAEVPAAEQARIVTSVRGY